METFLIKGAQLIVALAILIIIHEFGHFFFSRIFGVRVEKFYIFFDPKFELFKWFPKRYYGFFGKTKKLKGYKDEGEQVSDRGVDEASKPAIVEPASPKKRSFWGETEYGIGWIPLGGYCKIAGMIDESMDTEQMKQPEQEWEFRSKPAWQRLLIMVGGVLFNFLLAIVIYAGIVYTQGEKYVPLKDVTLGMQYSEEAHKIGFKDGDIPLMADGISLEGNPMEDRLKMIQSKEVIVSRGGKQVKISIPSKFMLSLDEEAKREDTEIAFLSFRVPVRINQIAAGEGAAKGGLEVGDQIISIDGTPTPSLYEFFATLPGHDNKTVRLQVVRGDGERRDTLEKAVTLSSSSKMGIGLDTDPSLFYTYKKKRYNIFESVPRGIEMGVDRLVSYAKSMKLIFTKEGASSIGGFGAIGSIFPETWNWLAFWNIAAFLSVALAFMNILPIPALDGGHVIFLLYEVIFRRKPGDKFMERAQIVGMILLISLLVYANGMDIIRLFK